MPIQPQPRWQTIHGEPCWTIDWRELFSGGLKFWEPRRGGEMRGFHVVFRVRMRGSGTLIFWDDDGCLIRRGGQLIHSDRNAHELARSEISVSASDRLEVAQWQHDGDWMWGARLTPGVDDEPQAAADSLRPYLNAVERRLRNPDGPPLKMYFSGASPLRTVLSLYSMIINGYSPSNVLIFGDYQWPAASRELFETLLPFAHIVPTEGVLQRIESLGGSRLLELARQRWFVMKICVGLLCPPAEFCFMDDDVFILGRIDEALRAFQKCNLVFAPDADYSADYLAAWGWMCGKDRPLRTGTINTGLYCLRNVIEPRKLAAEILRGPATGLPGWQWEQGFMACQYADESVCALPAVRYFYPYFDGLPGGLLNYDYALNPCGFVSIHFGGLAEKPSDTAALILAPEILGGLKP